MGNNNHKTLIFSQHGMIDDNQAMAALAYQVAHPNSQIIAPSLDFLDTIFNLNSLIDQVEKIVSLNLHKYSDLPVRIIATSLGGIIWIEVLDRNAEWCQKVESLVLLGSPIGGSDVARIVDPFGLGIGMAKYLGQDRRAMAEAITKRIPTLVIAGNIRNGHDGIVTKQSTKLAYSHFICLDGVNHADLRRHPAVIREIREFWSKPRTPLSAVPNNLTAQLIQYFRAVPGITDTNERDFSNATLVFTFRNGTSIYTWKNLVGVNHIFIANDEGNCEYAALVGWIHTPSLQKAIDQAIKIFGRL